MDAACIFIIRGASRKSAAVTYDEDREDFTFAHLQKNQIIAWRYSKRQAHHCRLALRNNYAASGKIASWRVCTNDERLHGRADDDLQ
jgi:hypothetical protein